MPSTPASSRFGPPEPSDGTGWWRWPGPASEAAGAWVSVCAPGSWVSAWPPGWCQTWTTDVSPPVWPPGPHQATSTPW